MITDPGNKLRYDQCDLTLIHVNDVTECHSMLTNGNEMLTILLNVPQC